MLSNVIIQIASFMVENTLDKVCGRLSGSLHIIIFSRVKPFQAAFCLAFRSIPNFLSLSRINFLKRKIFFLDSVLVKVGFFEDLIKLTANYCNNSDCILMIFFLKFVSSNAPFLWAWPIYWFSFFFFF